MTVVEGANLARHKVNFVQEAIDTVHLHHVLYVLLVCEPLQGNVELTIAFVAGIVACESFTATLETAAEGVDDKDEAVIPVTILKLAPRRYVLFHCPLCILVVVR